MAGADRPAVRLIRRSFPDRAAFSTAVSRALLERVAAGELPSTMRLHRPGRVIAFGRQDVASTGYRDAVQAARAVGFQPVQRLAGGRAAVYHQGTLALSRAVADRRPAEHTEARFVELSEAIVATLRRLGADARVGEVPGEYCPGAWSVNARGERKVAGIGQRMIAGAAHIGCVIVVRDSASVRRALVPVYRALGLAWDPRTAGSLEDEGAEHDLGAVEDALLAELGSRHRLVEGDLDRGTVTRAETLEADFSAP